MVKTMVIDLPIVNRCEAMTIRDVSSTQIRESEINSTVYKNGFFFVGSYHPVTNASSFSNGYFRFESQGMTDGLRNHVHKTEGTSNTK